MSDQRILQIKDQEHSKQILDKKYSEPKSLLETNFLSELSRRDILIEELKGQLKNCLTQTTRIERELNQKLRNYKEEFTSLNSETKSTRFRDERLRNFKAEKN